MANGLSSVFHAVNLMFLFRVIFLLIIFLTFNTNSFAYAEAEACYDDSSYAAEQMVRFQTQLMVIGMVCQRYSADDNKDTYQKYQIFSKRNEDLIRKYEQDLVELYSKEQKKQPERALHNLRTNIANDLSRYAMRMTPERFCDFFESRIGQALSMNQVELNEIINRTTEGQISSRPLCEITKIQKN